VDVQALLEALEILGALLLRADTPESVRAEIQQAHDRVSAWVCELDEGEPQQEGRALGRRRGE
jgi:hypothetical protein